MPVTPWVFISNIRSRPSAATTASSVSSINYPRHARSLYLKDEDYRFSYLYGSYVTLTNVEEPDLQRIIEQQLSPLYVSVHATEEQLRTRLLGRRGPPVLELLGRLTAAGIEIHTQVVLCPGINDGAELERPSRICTPCTRGPLAGGCPGRD